MKKIIDYYRILFGCNDLKQCCYLEEKKLLEIGKDPEFYDDNRILGDPLTYYCSLTNKHCVGTRLAWFISSSDKVDFSIVKRCPSRKTIDDSIDEE